METVRDLRGKAEEQREEYAGDERRPLGSYAALLAAYGASVSALGFVVRRRGRPLPERPSAADLALMAVATHKVSRMVSKDSVLSAVRAPFTRFKEPAGAGEVNEEVRGEGARHAVGELISCPFCMAQWVATGRPRTEAGDAVDDVHHEVEAVEIVEHDHVERRRGRALLLVPPHVQVGVAVTAVRQPVDEPRVPVVGEDDRPGGGEEVVEL